MNRTNNLIEPQLYMNPNKNLIEPKLYTVHSRLVDLVNNININPKNIIKCNYLYKFISDALEIRNTFVILSVWMEWIRIKLISPGCFSTCSIGGVVVFPAQKLFFAVWHVRFLIQHDNVHLNGSIFLAKFYLKLYAFTFWTLCGFNYYWHYFHM